VFRLWQGLASRPRLEFVEDALQAAEFLITTVRNREEYNALIGPMEFWGDRMAHKPWTARI